MPKSRTATIVILNIDVNQTYIRAMGSALNSSNNRGRSGAREGGGGGSGGLDPHARIKRHFAQFGILVAPEVAQYRIRIFRAHS